MNDEDIKTIQAQLAAVRLPLLIESEDIKCLWRERDYLVQELQDLKSTDSKVLLVCVQVLNFLHKVKPTVVRPAFIEDDQENSREQEEPVEDRIMPVTAVPAKTKSNNPPKFGEFICYLFWPKIGRDAVLGDLAEDYTTVFNKFGRRWAWWFYYCQVAKSLGPLAARLTRKAMKWGVISEAVRRIFS